MLKQEEIIEKEIVKALKAKDEFKVGAYRFIKSAIKNARIEVGEKFAEADLIKVLKREYKKRNEAAVAYKKGGSEDKAGRELKEAEIIAGFLPQELAEEKIAEVIQFVIKEKDFAGPESFGRAMKEVMAQLKGQADGGLVSKLLKEELSK